jgi:hypothetical protein
MQNRTLIILGMHRSGTSLITKWLHQCGLEVGRNLLGAGLGNKEGHFEDTEFYHLHMQILRDNNLHDSGILTNPVINLSDARKEEIKKVIAGKNQSFEQWGWKDPRTCLFLDFYREILPDAYYFVVVRDYHSVIISLLIRTFALQDIIYDTQKGYFSRLAWHKWRRRREFKKFCHLQATFFLQVWIFNNQQILKNIESLPADKYLVINFFELLHKDKDVISYVNNKWNFTLNYLKFSDTYNEKLLSKPFDIGPYVKDKKLVRDAEILMGRLEKYAHNTE